MDDFYLIAEIQDTFNSDGFVVIKSFSDFYERFFELERVIIDFFGKVKELEIEFVNETDGLLIIKFFRFNSREDVQFLIGKKLYVRKDQLYNLPADTYYIHDLIDSKVYLEELFFGKLVDVLNLPSNDVYVIIQNNGSEVLIPAVKKYILNFNLDEKILYLDPDCKNLIEDEN